MEMALDQGPNSLYSLFFFFLHTNLEAPKALLGWVGINKQRKMQWPPCLVTLVPSMVVSLLVRLHWGISVSATGPICLGAD